MHWQIIRRLALIVLVLSGLNTRAQNFSSFEIGAGGMMAPGEEFKGLWEVKVGGSGYVSAPFYGGELDVSLRAFEVNETSNEVPGFVSIQGALGWGMAVSLPARVDMVVGGCVGLMLMRFGEDDDFPAGLQNESELTTGVFTRFTLPVRDNWSVFAQAEWTRMYLNTPVTFVFAEAGISIQLDSPVWIQEVLK